MPPPLAADIPGDDDEFVQEARKLGRGFLKDEAKLAENWEKLSLVREALVSKFAARIREEVGEQLDRRRAEAASATSSGPRVPSEREIVHRYMLSASPRMLALVGTHIDAERIAETRRRLGDLIGDETAAHLIEEMEFLLLKYARDLEQTPVTEMEKIVHEERGILHNVLHEPQGQREYMAELQSTLRYEYDTPESVSHLLRGRNVLLEHFFGSIFALRGRAVLDIGCGSSQTREGSGIAMNERWYEPWFARVMQHAGAHVTGIDIHDSESEPGRPEAYEHLQRDLTDPRALDDLPDDTFEVVNSNGFLGTTDRDQASTSPHLLHQSTEQHLSLRGLDRQIDTQVLRILREGGIYLKNSYVLEKRNGVLQPVTPADYCARHSVR
jgi:SAM-dependent methyltransferase